MYLMYLLIFQAIATCLSDDVKLEGVKTNEIRRRLVSDVLNIFKEDPKMGVTSAMEKNKGAKPEENVLELANYEDFLPSKTKQLKDYVYHIQKKGVSVFSNIAAHVMKEGNLKINLNRFIEIYSNEFIASTQEYMNIVSAHKTKHDIDEEFVFLDVVETFNRLIYKGGKKLTNDIFMAINDTSKAADFQLIYNKLFKDSVIGKKDELSYICSHYEVCRYYPSFTDYSADFISEILSMPDSKFKIVADIIKNVIFSEGFFFKSITRPDDRDIIIQELSNYMYGILNMREFLSVLRTVMIHRYKIMHNSNPVLKVRIKAVKILLDMLDKALSRDGKDVVSIDFTNTVHAMRFWIRGQRNDIDIFLGKFIKNIIRTLSHVFNKDTREEIKVLIEIILRGRFDNKDGYGYLEKIGSKFVKGENDVMEFL